MNYQASDSNQDWQRKVKLLCASAWQDANLNQSKIDLWLENFSGAFLSQDIEQNHAFHLLQQFIYFGQKELTECLQVLFRDHFVYPFVQGQNAARVPLNEIEAKLENSINDQTRFVAVGGAGESGHSFLYQFRKANNLPTKSFAIDRDVVKLSSSSLINLEPSDLSHLIYLDDFCGTGQQVQDRVGHLVRSLRKGQKNVRVSYYLLFATEQGINKLKAMDLFDEVAAAIVFDSDYRAFGESSHYYKELPEGVEPTTGLQIMKGYGARLFSEPLGYGDCQLMVGFCHNTPDNTLPVFWASGFREKWHPLFPRVHKV